MQRAELLELNAKDRAVGSNGAHGAARPQRRRTAPILRNENLTRSSRHCCVYVGHSRPDPRSVHLARNEPRALPGLRTATRSRSSGPSAASQPEMMTTPTERSPLPRPADDPKRVAPNQTQRFGAFVAERRVPTTQDMPCVVPPEQTCSEHKSTEREPESRPLSEDPPPFQAAARTTTGEYSIISKSTRRRK